MWDLNWTQQFTVQASGCMKIGAWRFLIDSVCVFICVGGFSHLLNYFCTHGRSQASSVMSSILFRKRLLIYGHLPSFSSVALSTSWTTAPTPPFESASHPTITYCTRKHVHTLLLMPVSNGLRQEWPAPLQEVVCSPVLMPGSTYFALCFAKFFSPLMSHIPCFRLFLGKCIWSVWEVNAFDSISFSSGLSFALVSCSQKLQRTQYFL